MPTELQPGWCPETGRFCREVRAEIARLQTMSAPSEDEVGKIIEDAIRGFDLGGGSILDAIAYYCGHRTIKEAREHVETISGYAAGDIMKRFRNG